MINPRRFQRNEDHHYHLSSGLESDLWINWNHHERWQIIKTALQLTQKKTQLTVHATVLMGTHLHLLFATQDLGENLIVEEFHRQLKLIFQTKNDLLETPLFCEPIENYKQFLNTYKYIYRNPVEAGLCHRVEEYNFSTLRELLGLDLNNQTAEKIAIDPLGLPQQPFRMLDWLNHANKEIYGQF